MSGIEQTECTSSVWGFTKCEKEGCFFFLSGTVRSDVEERVAEEHLA